MKLKKDEYLSFAKIAGIAEKKCVGASIENVIVEVGPEIFSELLTNVPTKRTNTGSGIVEVCDASGKLKFESRYHDFLIVRNRQLDDKEFIVKKREVVEVSVSESDLN